MKPGTFEYHLPASVDETVDLLGDYGPEAKVLAGGQSLVPLLSLRLARVEHLVDINRVDGLSYIDVDGGLTIGALTRHRHGERSPVVADNCPLLASALGYIGHAAIRNRGTICGSVAHADPAAELPATLLALDGSVTVASTRGPRVVEAADLFTGFLTTSLEPDELLTAVLLPPWKKGAGWSVQEFGRRSGDFAIAGAATVLVVDRAGKIDDARVALFGVASTAVRASAAERILLGESPSDELFTEASQQATVGLDPPSDLHGTSAYRVHLTRAMVRRSLVEAMSRTGAPV